MLPFFFCVEGLPNSFFLGIPQKNRNIATKPIHAGLGGVISLHVMKHYKTARKAHPSAPTAPRTIIPKKLRLGRPKQGYVL